MKKGNNLVGWAFWIGAILSVLFGIGSAARAGYTSNPWIPTILVVLGIVVGLANVSAKEMTSFLVAALGLFVFASVFSQVTVPVLSWIATLLGSAVQAFALFIGGAAIVVAVKEAWGMASKM
jgi:hypothetical protein